MSGRDESSGTRAARLDRAIAGWLEAVDRDEPRSRERAIARHPDLRLELEAFFAESDALQSVETGIFDGSELRPSGRGSRPERIGRYRLLDEIGRGGMGVVFLAEREDAVDRFALKWLPASAIAGEEAVRRAEIEIATLESLEHESVVEIVEHGVHEGAPWFVMPLYPGGNLTARLDAFGAPRDAARLVARLARGVAHAHERGVLHRDLKPSNVLFDAGERAVVADFGLAKSLASKHTSLTRSGDMIGTARYMSPERLLGEPATVRGDVYSLGRVLLELLAGPEALDDSAPVDLLRRAVVDTRPDLLRKHEDVPQDLVAVAGCALEREPRRRYASAVEFAEDLERFLEGRPVLARSISWHRRLRASCREHPAGATAVISLAILVLAVVVGSLFHAHREHEMTLEIRGRDAVNRHFRHARELEQAFASWRSGSIDETLRSLESLKPGPGDTDLRGFAWHHLRHRIQAAALREVTNGGPRGLAAVWISSDGRRLVHHSGDRVRLFALDREDGLRESLVAIDDTRLVGFDASSPEFVLARDDGLIELRSLESGETLERVSMTSTEAPPGGELLAIAFAGRARTCIVLRAPDRLERLELRDGSVPELLGTLSRPARGPVSMQISADGGRIAVSASSWKGVEIWRDASGGSSHRAFKGPVNALAMSPDGLTVAVAVPGPDWTYSVRLVDLDSGVETVTAGRHPARIERLGFSSSGRLLVTEDSRGRIAIRDLTTREVRAKLRVAPRGLAACLTSAEERLIVFTSEGQLEQHDLAGVPSPRRQGTSGRSIWLLGADEEANRLVSANEDGQLVLWQREGGELQAVARGDPPPGLRCGTISRDGALLVAGDESGVSFLRGVASGNRPPFGSLGRIEVGWPVRDVELSRDRRRLAILGAELRVVELSTDLDADERGVSIESTERVRFDLKALDVSANWRMRFSPDGSLLVVLGADRRLQLFDLVAGRYAGEISPDEDGSTPTSFEFDAKGTRLACAQVTGRVNVFHVGRTREGAPTLSRETALERHVSPVWGLAFSPRGELFSGDDTGRLLVWDLFEDRAETVGLVRADLEAHRGAIHALLFSGDGETLLSAGGTRREGELVVWRAPRDRE